jgi:hypothetical protein
MFILQTPPVPPVTSHPWDATQWGNLAQWAGAFLTFCAVVVALFKEDFLAWRRHPDLTVRLRPEHPDCVITPAGHNGWKGWRYFLRLWIQNDGNARAENVEVFLSRLSVERKRDVFEEMPGYAEKNLRWSHGDFWKPTILVGGISPGMGRYCDLVAMSDPNHPDLRNLPDNPGKTRLGIQYEVLGPGADWPGPGRYKFEISVSASNRRPVRYVIDFRLTGLWSEKEEEMFKGGFVITVQKG